jgi:sulfite exporter TauE/SafE
MLTLVLAVLAASLVGSPHCAGMCGAFVCFYAGDGAGARGRSLAHVAYNGGRLVSYALLGATAGALGAGLDAAGRLAGLARPAAVAAGALMVAWGAARIAAAYGVRVSAWRAGGEEGPGALRRGLGALLRRSRGRPPVVRAAATGLLTTLLPCGWLWAFVATAAGTGSARAGALVMLAFWAGTLPVLVAVGVGAQRLLGPFARRLPVASAALLVALGLATLAGKLRPDAALHAHAAPAPAHAHQPSGHVPR